MLQLFKNEAVTHVAREQIEVRKMELDWYTTNYDTMAMQAAMFAGFAFEQMSEPVPEGTDLFLEVTYVSLTAFALGFELCVCMSCTFCCIFGKGLALRGPHGSRSIHVAVDNLQKEQKLVFTQFMLGGLAYLVSHIIEIWIYFRPRIAGTVSIPLCFFFFLIVYYTIDITSKLQVREDRALTGQIAAFGPYERIRDLDSEIYAPLERKHANYQQGRMTGTGARY